MVQQLKNLKVFGTSEIFIAFLELLGKAKQGTALSNHSPQKVYKTQHLPPSYWSKTDRNGGQFFF